MENNDADIIDVSVVNHGTVWTFSPLTDAGREWVAEKLDLAVWQWVGDKTFVVDHRPARNIADGMRGDGLVVADEPRGA